jgi:hypothetical protein
MAATDVFADTRQQNFFVGVIVAVRLFKRIARVSKFRACSRMYIRDPPPRRTRSTRMVGLPGALQNSPHLAGCMAVDSLRVGGWVFPVGVPLLVVKLHFGLVVHRG